MNTSFGMKTEPTAGNPASEQPKVVKRAKYHFEPWGQVNPQTKTPLMQVRSLTPPVPFKQLKDFVSPEGLDAAQKTILNWYTTRVTKSLTGYELELETLVRNKELIQDFKGAIKNHSGEKPPVVIFDIDETVLSNLGLSELTNFTSKPGLTADNPCSPYHFRVNKKCTQINPMTNFCKRLQVMGYTLIYISSRRGTPEMYQATTDNLKAAEIVLNNITMINQGKKKLEDKLGLFLTPIDLFGKMATGKWKESVRKDISEVYEIIGCVGDSADDWSGEHTGSITVNVPNYLY